MVFVFFFWLISLSMIISRSIHVAANGIISFFFYDWKELISYLQGNLEPNHIFNFTFFSSLTTKAFHNEQSLPVSLSSGFCPLIPAWSLACHAHKVLPSYILFTSVQFSRSVMSNSFWPHELQHARPPCPSPTPGVHSDSCPLSRWCHPAILSSVVPFSSCPQSLSASESFPMSQLFAWDGQSTGVSALASFLPKKSQGWSPSEWTVLH